MVRRLKILRHLTLFTLFCICSATDLPSPTIAQPNADRLQTECRVMRLGLTCCKEIACSKFGFDCRMQNRGELKG